MIKFSAFDVCASVSKCAVVSIDISEHVCILVCFYGKVVGNLVWEGKVWLVVDI